MSTVPPNVAEHAPPSAQPIELDLRRALRFAWRALRLRCPHCAGRGIFRSPLTLRPDCPTCGLQLDRGEPDYVLGAYMINLVAVELLCAALLVGVVVGTWPTPPWELLQYGAAALMIVGAVVCYPFAKVLWIAMDLTLRPVEPDELPGPLPPELLPDPPRGPRASRPH
jgi:uncharacterized protein (DUF983 family)